LFNISSGWATGTSVNEIIKKGIARAKIVVGKVAYKNDSDSLSYMTPLSLSNAFVA